MKTALRKLMIVLFAIAALAAWMLAEQPQAVLGKINYVELFDSAPAMPSSTIEAGKRIYGADLEATSYTNLTPFYKPYNDRLEAGRNILKPAVASRAANQPALGQRTVDQANKSPIVSAIGGVDKIGEMSEVEVQQAAAKAAGNYQQAHSGAPPNTQGGGMQAMMQRLMSDPAYQERFEKMSKKEQEAELQKYTGSAQPPAPPSTPTAAERQAQHTTAETEAAMARQKEVFAILQRIQNIDEGFADKDKAISTTPGNHREIRQQIQAKIEKIPMVDSGEMGKVHDPIKVRAVMREQATLDRNRAALELQKRTTLYAERKGRYKEVATSYRTWLKQSTTVTSSTAALLNDASADAALQCEEELVNLGDNLRKYHEDTTREIAQYEQIYHKRMTRDEIY